MSVQYADTPYGYNLYNLDLIQAPCNWNQETTGSKDIAVCIIDSGIQTNHPDLAANVWVNDAEIPNNGIDDDGNGMSFAVSTQLQAATCLPVSAFGCFYNHNLQDLLTGKCKYITGFSSPIFGTMLCVLSLQQKQTQESTGMHAWHAILIYKLTSCNHLSKFCTSLLLEPL